MKKRSKLLIFAVPLMAVLLTAVVFQYGYVNIRADLKQSRDMAQAKTRTLMKYRTLISEKPLLEEKLAALQKARQIENLNLIEGMTVSLAAASLQNTVKAVILARGGSIASERTEKPEDRGNFKLITVTIDALLPDTRALGETLYGIETQTPHLVVRELDTRIKNFRDPKELLIKLKVSGLTQGR